MEYSDLDKYFCYDNNSSSTKMFSSFSKHPQIKSIINNQILNSQSNQKSDLSKPMQISLISGKRSLSINIFLKMFKNVELLKENIRTFNANLIGIDRLKMLVQLLPSEEEVFFNN